MLNWTATQHSGEKKSFPASTFQNFLTIQYPTESGTKSVL